METTFLPLYREGWTPQEGGRPATAQDLADALHKEVRRGAQTGHRPYLLLNMIASVDGKATVKGRSGPLGGAADRALFHALRTIPDGVLVGARTLQVERYNRLVADPARRALREGRGLRGEPFACILSSSLSLDPTLPLLQEGTTEVVVLTDREGELCGLTGTTHYLRYPGGVELSGGLADLKSRFGITVLLCEGGPTLAHQLVAADLLDELLLTVAPCLAGGEAPFLPTAAAAGRAANPDRVLPLLHGAALLPPRSLRLRWAYLADSFLFLRYALRDRRPAVCSGA